MFRFCKRFRTRQGVRLRQGLEYTLLYLLFSGFSNIVIFKLFVLFVYITVLWGQGRRGENHFPIRCFPPSVFAVRFSLLCIYGFVLFEVSLWYAGVAAKVCIFSQEPDPDQRGSLRWVLPLENRDLCACSEIRPGGVTMVTPKRGFRPYYTDHPIFTDDPEIIHDYFKCHGENLQIIPMWQYSEEWHSNKLGIEVQVQDIIVLKVRYLLV